MKPRGFANLTPERRREIAVMGGKAAHAGPNPPRTFTPAEARVAGKKGGQTVSRDRAHMAEIGRMGGAAKKAKQYA
jgi:general stress protein YciG